MNYLKSMHGLGDNIYIRSFLTNINEETYLATPWPQMFKDLKHVKLVEMKSQFRTQAKNIAKQKIKYDKLPFQLNRQISYGELGPIPGLSKFFNRELDRMSLPSYGGRTIDQPYVLVRPATVRKEWIAESRNPKPEYISIAADIARSKGYLVVSVADLQDGEEWALDPLPKADIVFNHGELDFELLMRMTEHASAVIGGVGWIVPAAQAYDIPGWIICGGQGFYNHPDKINNDNYSKLTYAVPDEYCLCKIRDHQCNKEISNYENKFTDWITQLV